MDATPESYLQHLSKEQTELTDCVLVSEDKREFACHSLLLFNASPVLNGLEDTQKLDVKLRVPFEAKGEIVRIFLTWLYTSKLPATDPQLEELLSLADLYNIKSMLPLLRTWMLTVYSHLSPHKL